MSQSDKLQSLNVQCNFKNKSQREKKKKRKQETLSSINIDSSDNMDTDLARSKNDKQSLSKNHHKRSKYSMKYSTKCTSTPHGNVSVKPHSISLSGIDTGSSSSENVNNSALQRKIPETDNKTMKNKKRANKIKQRKFLVENTDSEWETKSEELINECLSPQKGSKASAISTSINLFKSLDTSEKIRDMPIRFEESGSPIIQPVRRSRLISKDIDIAQQQQDQLLPVDLPSLERRNLFDTDEDDLILHREPNVKTYPPARKSRRSPEVKLEHFMFSGKPSTVVSDQLWNEFIEKHYGKNSSPYYKPLSAQNSNMQEATTSTSSEPKSSRLPGTWSLIFDKLEVDPIPPGATVLRGWYNEDLKKWEHEVRVEPGNDKRGNLKRKKTQRKKKTLTSPLSRREKIGPYDQIVWSESDSDFKTDEKGNKRITLAQYRQKMKKEMKKKKNTM